MPVSPYFKPYDYVSEQNLLHDLTIEAIQIYGMDMYYVTRKLEKYNKLLGEDAISKYDLAIELEMYIKNIHGFSGDGNFMSKFGLEIRDQIVFIISQRRFTDLVSSVANIDRPREGDLIYFPKNKKCYKIMYVNKFDQFYPLGTLPTWELTTELFEYSNEIFDTGIEDIDNLMSNYNTDVLNYAILTENNEYLLTQDGEYVINENYDFEDLSLVADNKAIQEGTENYPDGSDDIIDFDEKNPFAPYDY